MTFDEFKSLMIADRTVRRYDHSVKVGDDTLRRLVELTRYCPSGRNAQMLRYRLVRDEGELEEVYKALKWAGYYTDWDGPAPEERPTAYLVQCLDTKFGANCLCDDGLQLMAITLGATALGLSCCIVKAFNAAGVSLALRLPERYRPNYVLAIGKGVEKVQLEEMDRSDDADFRYFRTPDGVHHVPKRLLDELII